MSGKRYPEEFKTEAVKQVVDRGYSVASVATRLDITTHSLYAWIKKYGPDSSTNKEQSDAQAEIRRLQKELKRVTDERDILKKAALDVRLPEQFSIIGKLRARYPVATLCHVFGVHRSSYKYWKNRPEKPDGRRAVLGVSLDIENYCTLRPFFDLSTLAGLSRRNLPEAGIRLLFQI